MVEALDQVLTFRAVQGNVDLTKASMDRFVGLSRLQCLVQPLNQIFRSRQLCELSPPRTGPPFWSSGPDGTIPWELLHGPPGRVIEVSWTTAHHPNKRSPVFMFIDVLIGLRCEAVLFFQGRLGASSVAGTRSLSLVVRSSWKIQPVFPRR